MKTYRDHYFKKAKAEGYPARSVYKLQEIDRRFKLLSSGRRVLDLGAAPGSWSLYAGERVAPAGLVLAVDIAEWAPGTAGAGAPRVRFLRADVLEGSPALDAALAEVGPFDVVLSDMAPKTTGVRFADQAHSLELAMRALSLAERWLRPGGNFVVKVFMGPDVAELERAMRVVFETVRNYKPKGSRAESFEIFALGLGRLGGTE